MEKFQRAAAQREGGGRIKSSREQAILRPLQADPVAQLRFRELSVVSDLSQQALLFQDRFDGDLQLRLGFDFVARAKADPF